MHTIRTLLRRIVVLSIGVLAAQPLLIHGLPIGSDTYYHVQRTASLARALEQGVLYPRWSADLAYGFGYPVFHYYAPLGYYVPALLTLLGLPAVQAVTLFAAAMFLLQALGVWLWLRSVFEDEVAAFGGSVAYTLSPYVVDNLVGRGALAEHFALAAAPFALWGLTLLSNTKRALWFGVAVFSLAALFLAHNVSALMLAAVLAAYAAFLSASYQNLLAWVALLLGGGLSLFFWLPALSEREFVQLDRLHTAGWANFRDYFMPLEAHFALPEPVDLRLVFQPRQAALNAFLLVPAVVGATAAVIRFARRGDKRAALILGSLIGFAGALLMTHRASLPLWEAVENLKFLQFPWRFYVIVSLCLALVVAGASTALSPIVARHPLASSIALATLLGFSAAYVFPRQIPREVIPVDLELTPHAIAKFEQRTSYIGTTTAGEYLPIWVKELPPFSLSPFAEPETPFASAKRLAPELSSPWVEVLTERYTLYRYELQLVAPITATLTFKAFDFPGWNAYVDGNAAKKTAQSPYGLLQVEVPPGSHEVVVTFENTPVRTLGEILSLLSLLACAAIIAAWRYVGGSARVEETKRFHPSPLRWEILALAALGTFALKTLWVDRTETPFAFTRFDGVNVRDADVTLQRQFGEGLVLIGADLDDVKQPAFNIRLYWRLAQPIERELSSSVQLVDEQGFIVGQSDNQHPSGYPVPYWRLGYYARDTHTIRIFPGTPPGTYTLYARVYPYGQPDKPLSVSGSGESAVKIAQVVLPPLSWSGSLEELAAEHYRQPERREALALVAYNQHRDRVRVGEMLPLTFFWRAQQPLSRSLTATLALINAQGDTVSAFSFPPVANHATDRWRQGEVWRGNHRLRVPRRLEGGTYRLELRYDDTRVLLNERLEVIAPRREFAPPQEGVQVWYPFADAGALAAFSAPEQTSPGATITVRLVWRATHETDRAYKVFVHLLNPAGEYVTGHDSEPANWERPTTSWVIGEYVLDDHPITIPEQGSTRYTLRVGLYDAETGVRVRTVQGDDGVTLPISLIVSAP